jgi:hypothetical protein
MVDLKTMTEAEILEFAQNLSEDEFNELDEASQEIITNVTEATAADTLKPGAGSGGTESKAQMLATFAALAAQLGKEDLSDLFNRTIATIGQEAQNIPNDAAAKNAATIAMKGAVKEDIDDMFSADDLSEEFKEKATTVFEAAVAVRATLKEAELQEEFEETVEALEEEFEAKLQEETSKIFEELSEKLDQYLDYTIKEWLEENKLAVENSLRAEIAEDFIQGLHGLFAEHYIRVPDEQIDLVAEMKTELEEVKAKLNETVDSKLELEAIINEATREAAIDEISEGLSAIQTEKLRTLAEGIEFTDAETYSKKLSILKENVSAKKAPKSTGFITEEIDGSDGEEDKTAAVPAHMQHYMTAISKSVK